VNEPDFLTLDDVLLLHEEQLKEYGGGAGIRDRALLDSAIGMPQQSFGGALVHEDLFAMAAAYAFHIGQNQPFIDGNKRTALAAALVFLDLHGVSVADPDGALYQAMIDIAEKRLDKWGLADLIRNLAATTEP
jgi:death-on-curing protein